MTTSLSFTDALREQRWDDHRLYHHSRINQSLHLLSASCFLTAYVAIWFSPVAAALLGWFGAMIPRQIGHFFFEPKQYDEINQATHQHKEDIKVGYNLRRKIILLSVWALAPIVLWLRPDGLGLFRPHTTTWGFVENVAVAWLVIAAGAVLVRTLFLMWRDGWQHGLVWAFKILTDPFHDVKIYHKAPLYVLRGELLDPMEDDWGPAQATAKP